MSIRRVFPLWILFGALALTRAATPLPLSVPRYTNPGGSQVIYFVLPDRFANGSTANDRGGLSGGREQTGFDPTEIGYFHGGDFVGLTAKLDYIAGLGVTTIWVTPPFKNRAVQENSAAYHGYWIEDFTRIDPHLGTDAEFREFVEAAHARGLRVILDIVVNHTADVIRYRDGNTQYVNLADVPYRDEAGRQFDPAEVAYNGLGDPGSFPRLSVERSFPHVPVVPAAEAHVKQPEWLNDVTLYHNRGNSLFQGENSIYGDFGGLDDVFTENPVVVNGFIDVYRRWMRDYRIDGFRIDTVRHVNLQFWEAFGPAIRAQALALGRPGFVTFGEVSGGQYDPSFRSEFTTTGRLDGTLDFGFSNAARDFVSRGGSADELARFFRLDGWYTWHDRNAGCAATFISNHDDGRFAYFLRTDNPRATPEQLGQMVLLGHELLLTARGLPSVYYGDEQGMSGLGYDMGAREDMFPSRAEKFQRLTLLGSARTGLDDKFDPGHPFYRTIARLARLRATEPALNRGAMQVRDTGNLNVFAFSRIDRDERREFVVALNNSRTARAQVAVPTYAPAGSRFEQIFGRGDRPEASPASRVADGAGRLLVTLAPLECVIFRAERLLGQPPSGPHIRLGGIAPQSRAGFAAQLVDGQAFSARRELRAEVTGGDGWAEVTFVAQRQSRPRQYELIGTADAPPYRVFWRPPADCAPDERWSFTATVDDLRGGRDAASVEGVEVAAEHGPLGIKGATVPRLTSQPPAAITTARGGALTLSLAAEGTPPLEFEWIHNGKSISAEHGSTLARPRAAAADAGHYLILVRNREGTAVSHPVEVVVTP